MEIAVGQALELRGFDGWVGGGHLNSEQCERTAMNSFNFERLSAKLDSDIVSTDTRVLSIQSILLEDKSVT